MRTCFQPFFHLKQNNTSVTNLLYKNRRKNRFFAFIVIEKATKRQNVKKNLIILNRSKKPGLIQLKA